MKLRPLPFIARSLLTVLLPLLIIYTLMATNAGLQSIAWLVKHFVPGMQVVEVEGRVIGPLTIKQLNYHNQEIAMQLNQGVLDWQPGALLKGNIVVDNVQADRLIVQVLNTVKPKKKKQKNFTWLKHLYINQIKFNNIIIEPSHLTLQLKGSLAEQWNIQWQAQLQQGTVDSQTANAYRTGELHKLHTEITVELQRHGLEKTTVPEINKLEKVLQTLNGTITANGTLQGAKLAPTIAAKLAANVLTVEHIHAAKLQINITTDLTVNAHSTLTANASQLKYKNYLFKTINLQAVGQVNPALAIQWQLMAQINPDANYQGTINAKGNISGNYKTPAINTDITMQRARLKKISFDNLNAQLNATVAEQAQSKLSVNLRGLKIEKYQFAPVQLQVMFDRAQQLLFIQLAKGAVQYSMNEQTRTLTWQASQLNIYQQAQDVMAQGRLTLNAQQYLDVNLILPHYQFLKPLLPEQPVRGKISLLIQQIAPFLSAVPAIQNIKGVLRADLQVQGTYAKPQLLGAINLDNGSVDVPELELKIRNIRLNAQGSPTGLVEWAGQAQSGQGVLYLKGTIALANAGFLTNINLTGDNITVSNTEHYNIIASPDLQVKYADKRLTLSGVIKLPKADINLGQRSEQAVELSKDVVFVDEGRKKQTHDLPFYSQVKLIAGNNINLNYEGLKTQLRGQILINDAPNHAVTGLGQIDFYNGHYTYYGQTLQIRPSSKIIFNGVIDNPVLNIQAIKEIEITPASPSTANAMVPTSTNLSSMAVLPGQDMKITVGVSVQGNAKNPDISLFSEPAILDQTNILSYLVVGQPADQLGSAGASVLFDAASSLNFGGSTGQLKENLQQLQKDVGVDFNIKSSSYLNPETQQTQQSTSVVLGKALSPRIYVSYSIGLLDALNTLQIRYILSKYWTLQSTSSSMGNGVDLLYMIERGK